MILSPSGLSRRVDRLEKAGLVTRKRDPEDQRNIHARLSPKGERLWERLRPTHLRGIEERFGSRFSESEIATVSELLRRLNPRAADPDGEGD